MEILLNVGENLFAALIGFLIATGVQRFYNPVRWKLERLDADRFRLSRVSGPTAFSIVLGGYFPTNVAPHWLYYEPEHRDLDEPRSMPPIRQAAKGKWFDLHADPAHFGIYWIERSKWCRVSPDIHPTTNLLLYRRRDIERGKEIAAWVEQWGWVRQSGE